MALWTIREAARDLGTEEATVRGLVRAWRVQFHPVPRQGNAKGLDSATMRRLRRVLKPEPIATQ